MSFLPSSDHNYVNDEDETNVATMDVNESDIPIVTRLKNVCEAWAQINQSFADPAYFHGLLCTTVKLTLSPSWQSIEENDRLVLKDLLSHIKFWGCQAFASLLLNPWGNEDMFLDVGAERSISHICGNSCFFTPRNILRTIVEVLCYCGFRDLALHLCLVYRQCRCHKNDYFYADQAFTLLFSSGNIKRMVEEMKSMSCHDGVQLIRFILRNEDISVHPLVECLTQILLVRDLLGPSQYCCTLELMRIWCTLHYRQETDDEIVAEEAKKLGALALTSAHLYLLVDVLYNQYGKRFLPLYLKLYINALTIDINNLEYARQVDCKMSVQELETSMAGVYTKLSLLLVDSGKDNGGARECLLTAFSLEPTNERLNMLGNYASTQTSVWRYKRIYVFPCQGECHCTEKGLCRRDNELPPWYLDNVPHGILDSSLPGVSDALLQDLCVVVEGPRCHWLSWNLPWDELRKVCASYGDSSRQYRIDKDDRKMGIDSRMKRHGLHELKEEIQPAESVSRTSLLLMTLPVKEKPNLIMDDHLVEQPMKIKSPPSSPIEYPVLHIEDQLQNPKYDFLVNYELPLLEDLENSQFGASLTKCEATVPIESLSKNTESEISSKPLCSNFESFLNGKTRQIGLLPAKRNSNLFNKFSAQSTVNCSVEVSEQSKLRNSGQGDASITKSNPFLYSLLSNDSQPHSSFSFSKRMASKPRLFDLPSKSITLHSQSPSSKVEKSVSNQLNQVQSNASVDKNAVATTYIVQLGDRECATQSGFNHPDQRSSQTSFQSTSLTVNGRTLNHNNPKMVLKTHTNASYPLVAPSTSALTPESMLQIHPSNSQDVEYSENLISRQSKPISILGDSPERLSYCNNTFSPKEQNEHNHALNFPRLGESPPPELRGEIKKEVDESSSVQSANVKEINAISILSNRLHNVVALSLPSQTSTIVGPVLTSQSKLLQSSSFVLNKRLNCKRKLPILGRRNKGKKWESVRGAHGFTGYRIVEDQLTTSGNLLPHKIENRNSMPNINGFSKLEVSNVSSSSSIAQVTTMKVPLVKKCSPAFLSNNPFFNPAVPQTSQVPNVKDSISKAPKLGVPVLATLKPPSWTIAPFTKQTSSKQLSQSVCSSSSVSLNQNSTDLLIPRAISIDNNSSQHNMSITWPDNQNGDNKVAEHNEGIKLDLPNAVFTTQPVVNKTTSTANILRAVRIANCRGLKNTNNSTIATLSAKVVELAPSSSKQFSVTKVGQPKISQVNVLKNKNPRNSKKLGLGANRSVLLKRSFGPLNNVNISSSQLIPVNEASSTGNQILNTTIVTINKEILSASLNNLPIQQNANIGNVLAKLNPGVNGDLNTLIYKDVKPSTTSDHANQEIVTTHFKSLLPKKILNTAINNTILAERKVDAEKTFNGKATLNNHAKQSDDVDNCKLSTISPEERRILSTVDSDIKASSNKFFFEKIKEAPGYNFKCDMCSKRYVRECSLSKHKQTKHSETKLEDLPDNMVPSYTIPKLIKVATVKIDTHLTVNRSLQINEESASAPIVVSIVESTCELPTAIASCKLSSSVNEMPLKNCFVQLVRQDVEFSTESCIKSAENIETSILSESLSANATVEYEELDENKQDILEELDMICEEEKTEQNDVNNSCDIPLTSKIKTDDLKQNDGNDNHVSKKDEIENLKVPVEKLLRVQDNLIVVRDNSAIEAEEKFEMKDVNKLSSEENNWRFDEIEENRPDISFDVNIKENVYFDLEREDNLSVEGESGNNTPVLSHKFEEYVEKNQADKNESKITSVSQEIGDIRRGRTSSRTVKPPQKRGCPCCENVTPSSTQSQKKCKIDPSQISTNTFKKIIKKVRSAHVNKVHMSSSAKS